MHNPYEIPEEPYYMMDELIEAFKSKSLVVCHMHRQLTIDALTSHGYATASHESVCAWRVYPP